jgi:RNA polymerase sigma-70 factor, ECF subfamily
LAPDPDESSALLERARNGDAAALESLLHLVQPQLYRFSMKMCRHTEDAEDVLQDTMLTLARSFKDFRGASSLSTWLYTITRSFCIKKRRKSVYAPNHQESLDHLESIDRSALASNAPSPHEQAESAEVWQQVQASINKLEPAHREILVLRDVEGLKAKEVAEVVGISVAAVKSRLHRARADLRNYLADHAYTPKPGCPDIRQVFSEYLEGDLSPDICSTMQSHLESCALCAAECDGLKSALNACSSAECKVPADVQQRVHEALRVALKTLPAP